MPESGTKLSGIAAWAEAWRASDSANIAALGEQLAAAPDPDEIRRQALKWASSDARTEKFLGRTLLQNLADEAGDDEEQRLRSLVPWHVALNSGVVPTAQSGDFLICLAAQSLTNVGFSLLMAHTRCPVQIVDVSEGQFWSAFAALYISVVPAPLRDQLISFGVAVPTTDATPVLFPQTPEIESAEPETAPETQEVVATEEPTFVQTVWESQDKPIVTDDPSEFAEPIAEGTESDTDFAEIADLEPEDAEPEAGFTEVPDDEPAFPLWNRFSVEEMRSLRACPIGESDDGVEFLVAAPAESAARARLSELVGGSARIRIVSVDEVNAAWREQFGEDMVAVVAPAVIESEPEPAFEASTEPAISLEDVEEDLTALVAEVEEEIGVVSFAEEFEITETEMEEAGEPAPTPVHSDPDPVAVALVPSGLAWFARACPHRLEGETLVCWVTEPYDETLLSAIERRSGHALVVEPMPSDDVMEALYKAYGQELAGVIEPMLPAAPAPEPEPDNEPKVESAWEDVQPIAEPAIEVESANASTPRVDELLDAESDFETANSDVADVMGEAVSPLHLAGVDFEETDETEVEDVPTSEAEAPKITFSEPIVTKETPEPPRSSLDQLLDDLALDPPLPPVEQEWRPRLAEPEPEFLNENFEEPSATVVEPELEPVAEIEPDLAIVDEIADLSLEPAAEITDEPVAVEEVAETELEPVAEIAEETVATEEFAEAESNLVSEGSDEPIAPPITRPAPSTGFADPEPLTHSSSKTDDPFTTEASADARRAWDEFMASNGNKANRAEAQVDAVMGRLNREIELDKVAETAVEGSSDEDEDPNDDSPVTQESAAWTTEEVEAARIGQRHADSVQRLIGHSTLPSPEILEKVMREMAIQNQIVPITIEEGTLHLISSHPIAPVDVRDLSHEIGMPLQLHLGSPEAVSRLITKAYPEPAGEEAVVHQMRVEEGRKQEDAAQQSWLDKLMNRVNKSG